MFSDLPQRLDCISLTCGIARIAERPYAAYVSFVEYIALTEAEKVLCYMLRRSPPRFDMFPMITSLSAVYSVKKGPGTEPSMQMSSLKIAAELAARIAVDIGGRDAGPGVGSNPVGIKEPELKVKSKL